MPLASAEPPAFLIVAGPNGSGMSSVYQDADIDAFGRSVWIINPNLLAVQALVLTDVATGWTECAPLLVREQVLMTEVLDEIRNAPPFGLLGFDTDNDTVASVNVVEFAGVAESATDQAALGGSCSVSGAAGGSASSAMPSACM